MSNNSEHCCLSCKVDISHKRIDAKYCSDRCRMRYRRKKIQDKLIEEIVGLFMQLSNHSVQFTDHGLRLIYLDAIEGSTQKWDISDLQTMSNEQLKELKKGKEAILAGENLAKLFSPIIQKIKG